MFFFNSETDLKYLDGESETETFRKNAKTCVFPIILVLYKRD